MKINSNICQYSSPLNGEAQDLATSASGHSRKFIWHGITASLLLIVMNLIGVGIAEGWDHAASTIITITLDTQQITIPTVEIPPLNTVPLLF